MTGRSSLAEVLAQYSAHTELLIRKINGIEAEIPIENDS
jgi:hypothetical protein